MLNEVMYEARIIEDLAEIIDFGPRYEQDSAAYVEDPPDDGASMPESVDGSVASFVLDTQHGYIGSATRNELSGISVRSQSKLETQPSPKILRRTELQNTL